MDKLAPHKIAPNLKHRLVPTHVGTSVPTIADAVRETIEAALPEFERWGIPGVSSDLPRVGHGIRTPSTEERVQELVGRAIVRPADRAIGDLDDDRVRAAQAIVNQLFAAFFARSPNVQDEGAVTALRGIVAQAETLEQTRKADRARALASLLMTELPAIYEAVQRDELEEPAQAALVTNLLARAGLLPSDPTVLDSVLDELVCEKCYIQAALELPDFADSTRTVTKLRGAVETASYTIAVALGMLGVGWPHQRGALMKARKLSDRARSAALSPGPFGSRVGPVEAVGYAQRAAVGGRRHVVELSTPSRISDKRTGRNASEHSHASSDPVAPGDRNTATLSGSGGMMLVETPGALLARPTAGSVGGRARR